MTTLGTIGHVSSTHPAARVPLDKSDPLESTLHWLSRRVYGNVLDPLKVGIHHRQVLFSTFGLELAAEQLPKNLQALAVMAPAQEIGCTWCLDFGYWESHHQGVNLEKLREIHSWRTTPSVRRRIKISTV